MNVCNDNHVKLVIHNLVCFFVYPGVSVGNAILQCSLLFFWGGCVCRKPCKECVVSISNPGNMEIEEIQ
jgi:hypothetical protein